MAIRKRRKGQTNDLQIILHRKLKLEQIPGVNSGKVTLSCSVCNTSRVTVKATRTSSDIEMVLNISLRK